MRTRKTDTYVDDDEIIPDGGSVRRRLILMDGRFADHRPGFRMGDAADRQVVRDARQQMIKRAENAWRMPTRDMNPGGGATCPECHGTGRDPDGDSPSGRCDACGGTGYIEAPNNSSSAQRRDPGRYPDPRLRTGGQPDNSSSPEAMRAHLQAQRDLAWNRYRDNLSNAWRQGRTDPGRADEIERQGEQWRHGK
jgi:hypothetical protein